MEKNTFQIHENYEDTHHLVQFLKNFKEKRHSDYSENWLLFRKIWNGLVGELKL